MSMGALQISNLAQRTLLICAQDLACSGTHSSGYAGSLNPDQAMLQVPAGKYVVKFDNHYLTDIEVNDKRMTTIELGAISIPNLSDQKFVVCDQQSVCAGSHSDGFAGYLDVEQKTLELPAGTYKLKINKHFVEGIEVGSNEEVVIEM